MPTFTELLPPTKSAPRSGIRWTPGGTGKGLLYIEKPKVQACYIVTELLGLRAEDPAEVRPMIEQALAHPGPALVDVVVNRQELAMPPTIDVAQAVGFSLYMIKAVLSGRGDEVIDLARTNLFR